MAFQEGTDKERGLGAVKHAATWKRAIIIGIAVMICCAYIIVAASSGCRKSAKIRYNSLDYQVQVMRNGDLRITEHIDVHLSKRSDDKQWRQLYQRYHLDPEQLLDITDISVRNTTTGETYTQIDPVRPGADVNPTWDSTYARHWYIETMGASSRYSSARPIVEIGWNIPAVGSVDSMGFDVSMTFKGVATAYDDVAAFQWEPIGSTNTVPIAKVTGTVTFPEGVTASNSRTWLHYEGKSTVSRDDNGTLHFTATRVESGMYLDVVAMFGVDQTADVARHRNGNYGPYLIDSEETKARNWERRVRDIFLRALALAAIGAALCAVLIWYVRRGYRKADFPREPGYRREPPDLTPNNAARLNGVIEHIPAKQTDARALSATMLSLASKHAITILPGDAESYEDVDISEADSVATLRGIPHPKGAYKADVSAGSPEITVTPDNVTIVLQPVGLDQRNRMSDSENSLLNLLTEVGRSKKTTAFDMRQVRALMKSSQTEAKAQLTMMARLKREFSDLNATVSMSHGSIVVCILAFIYLVACCALLVSNMFLQFVTVLPVAFCVGACMSFMRFTGLTDGGRKLASQLDAFKRYLVDFSDFTDRGAQDLVLWDTYLVYAAALGLSEQVMRQLADSVPELSDPAWLDEHASGTLVYSMYRPSFFTTFGATEGGSNVGGDMPLSFTDLGGQLSDGFTQVQAAAESMFGGSSGGSSGGFGGGGGGAGGGSFGGR